jgi:hypothetical protein
MTVTRGTGLGSARVPRAGERVLAIEDFSRNLPRLAARKFPGKFVAAGRRNQHAERVCYPETSPHII